MRLIRRSIIRRDIRFRNCGSRVAAGMQRECTIIAFLRNHRIGDAVPAIISVSFFIGDPRFSPCTHIDDYSLYRSLSRCSPRFHPPRSGKNAVCAAPPHSPCRRYLLGAGFTCLSRKRYTPCVTSRAMSTSANNRPRGSVLAYPADDRRVSRFAKEKKEKKGEGQARPFHDPSLSAGAFHRTGATSRMDRERRSSSARADAEVEAARRVNATATSNNSTPIDKGRDIPANVKEKGTSTDRVTSSLIYTKYPRNPSAFSRSTDRPTLVCVDLDDSKRISSSFSARDGVMIARARARCSTSFAISLDASRRVEFVAHGGGKLGKPRAFRKYTESPRAREVAGPGG